MVEPEHVFLGSGSREPPRHFGTCGIRGGIPTVAADLLLCGWICRGWHCPRKPPGWRYALCCCCEVGPTGFKSGGQSPMSRVCFFGLFLSSSTQHVLTRSGSTATHSYANSAMGESKDGRHHVVLCRRCAPFGGVFNPEIHRPTCLSIRYSYVYPLQVQDRLWFTLLLRLDLPCTTDILCHTWNLTENQIWDICNMGIRHSPGRCAY